VTFMDGATQMGSPVALVNGSATLIASWSTEGSHSITASYAGNADYLSSASTSAVSETVQDFAFTSGGGTATVTAATVYPGGSAVFTVYVAPSSGTTFAGPISFSLTGLPAGATYSISPSSIPAGSGAATVQITVNVPVASAALPASSGGAGLLKPFALALLLPMLGMRKLRRSLGRQGRASVLLLVLAVVMMLGMAGCGSTPPQVYNLTLTANSGTLTHSIPLTLTVH
jgi:hypothetical protein